MDDASRNRVPARGLRRVAWGLLALTLPLAFVAWSLQERTPPSPGAIMKSAGVAPRAAEARQLAFERNLGQAAGDVRYLSRAPGRQLAISDDGMTLSAAQNARARLNFVAARRGGRFAEREPLAARSNYLHGADPARWIVGAAQFRQLRYDELYPGIDLVYYSREGELEFDLVVRPGADPKTIRLQVAGTEDPVIDAEGQLLLDGKDGVLRMKRPVLHQNIDGQRITMNGNWRLDDHAALSFDVPAYDPRYPLVIDPVIKLQYSSYLTGFHDEQVGAMTLDAQGNAYVVGQTNSEDFVVSGNALQSRKSTVGLQYNVVVTKFDPTGQLVYSTYLGGTGSDTAAGIAVDSAGRAYVTGSTTSRDFPVTAGAHQATIKGSPSAFLAVLSPDGSSLSHATYYGASSSTQGLAVRLDAGGSPVLSGIAGPGLATTAGAYKTTLATGEAGFVARFSPLDSGTPQLLAASYYGVDDPQPNNTFQGVHVLAMALDATGAPWLTGQAFTTNLPVTTGAVQAAPTAMSGSCAPGPAALNSFAFVAALSADLRSLVYASYLSGATVPAGGAACSEFGRAIALDPAGNVYVAGATGSAGFPTTTGSIQPVFPSAGGLASYTGFMTRLAAGTRAVSWSTYLGGNGGNTFPGALVFNAAANAVWTTSVTGGGANYPITADAVQSTHGGGGADAGIVEVDASSGALRYSTYLGGSSADVGLAIAVDAAGNAFIAGNTYSPDFPLTANAYEREYRPDFYGGADWFLSIVGPGSLGTLSATLVGNTGDATIRVPGTGIQTGAVATLVSGASSTPAGNTAVLASDGAAAVFTFALAGAAPGVYDLVITNPDGSVLRKSAALTVEAGREAQLELGVVGRSTVRVGTPSALDISVRNTGDTDAYFAVVRVAIPVTMGAQFNFAALPPAFPGDTTDYRNITGTYTQDGIGYTLMVFPHVPVGVTATQSIDVTAMVEGAVGVELVLLPSYLSSAADLRALVAEVAPAARAGVLRLQPLISRTDAIKCASDVIILVCGAVGAGAGLGGGAVVGATVGVLASSVVVGGFVAASDFIDGNQGHSLQSVAVDGAQNVAQSILPNAAQNVANAFNIVNDCDRDNSIRNRIRYNMFGRFSIDPNDKTGPMGDGSASHYIQSPTKLDYQVSFENVASAGLPAAQVVISDTLDPAKYDLSTLSLGSVQWGTHRIDVPPGLKTYATTYAVDTTLSVRVQGSLDAASGVLKWTFTTLDPATRLPPSDPTIGFLPPNVNGTQGQGYVYFSVGPKSGLPEGTTWRNFASVVFDANAPIVTPTWVNTLDTTSPVSRVISATQQSGGSAVAVSWSATDSGSGPASYTVYVSDNGGPYSVWQSDVTTTTATYAGSVGHSYGYYVVARDGAGNTEAAKSTAEASLTVQDPALAGGGGGGCTVGGSAGRDGGLPLMLLAALALLWRRRVTARSSTRAACTR
ncbi:MAG: SBBP repeat-containing protein [Caldimonas sp.]